MRPSTTTDPPNRTPGSRVATTNGPHGQVHQDLPVLRDHEGPPEAPASSSGSSSDGGGGGGGGGSSSSSRRGRAPSKRSRSSNISGSRKRKSPPAMASSSRVATTAKSTPFTTLVTYFGPDGEHTVDNAATSSFQFVNTTKTNRRPDPGVLTLVRRHVAMVSNQNESLNHRKRKQRIEDDNSSSSSSANATALQPSLRDSAQILPPPGGSTLALYGSPVNFKSGDKAVIHFLLEETTKTFYPDEIRARLKYIPAKSLYAKACFEDPQMYRAMLYTSASCLYLYHGRSAIGKQAYDYMREAFAGLNRALEAESQMPSNGLVCAVAWLAHLSIALGYADEWNVHMSGVSQMLRIRGGLGTIEETLQTMVFQADVEGAVNSGYQPHLPPLTRTRKPLVDSTHTSWPIDRRHPTTHHIVSILQAQSVDSRIVSAFSNLCQFSSALSHLLSRDGGGLLDPRAIDEDLLLTLHTLASCSPSITYRPLDTVCQLCLVIYAKGFTRGLPLSATSSRTLMARLRYALLTLDGQPSVTRSLGPSLRFWLAVMGGMATAYFPDAAWWVERVRLAADELGLHGPWYDAVGPLSTTSWVREVHDKPLQQLWQQVEASRRASRNAAES